MEDQQPGPIRLYADLMQTLLATGLTGNRAADSRNRAIRFASDLIKSHGELLAVLEEVKRESHTDKCDWPHYKDAPCTCHMAAVKQAIATARGEA